MNLKINRLQHIGVPVSNLVISKAFYNHLGFTDVMNAGFIHQGGDGKVCMMQLDAIIMELYQMPEPELSKMRQRKDGHIDHIAFDVDDIDATFALLKNEGFAVIEEQPVFLNFWEKGCKYFNITGPDGERLEFCQIL